MEPEDPCTICWSNPVTRASIGNCRHTFCLECIEQWSARENRCPLCKIRFHSIHWKDAEGNANSKKYANQEPVHASARILCFREHDRQSSNATCPDLGANAKWVCLWFGSPAPSEFRPNTGEEHDVETCEICALMRSLERIRARTRPTDGDANGTD